MTNIQLKVVKPDMEDLAEVEKLITPDDDLAVRRIVERAHYQGMLAGMMILKLYGITPERVEVISRVARKNMEKLGGVETDKV